MKQTILIATMLLVSAAAAGQDTLGAQTYVVQDTDGYNSWPMVQAVRGKIVCAYSRGTAHDISQDIRAVYARSSSDGGKTWSPETTVASTPGYGESAIAKGLDEKGNLLLWVRRIGKEWNHDLYRSSDGIHFERIASLRPDPMPMQITDVFRVPKVGLMALWFAGYEKNSWGTLVSGDNGKTWTQHVVEADLAKSELPTEPSAIWLGKGRILVVARTEQEEDDPGKYQFQLTSTDYGKTWKKRRTNISDVRGSTPTLVLDKKTGLVSNYYYYRGKGLLKRRTVNANSIFDHPDKWPQPEVIAEASKSTWDAGNTNATADKGKHYISFYSGKPSHTSIFLTVVDKP